MSKVLHSIYFYFFIFTILHFGIPFYRLELQIKKVCAFRQIWSLLEHFVAIPDKMSKFNDRVFFSSFLQDTVARETFITHDTS